MKLLADGIAFLEQPINEDLAGSHFDSVEFDREDVRDLIHLADKLGSKVLKSYFKGLLHNFRPEQEAE